MKILAVDDEVMGLKALVSAISKADPAAEIVSFGSSQEALEYVTENKVDVAFLDIFMPGMSGIELAKKIKLSRPNTMIVFATGYDEYMKDAFSLHASGYVLKPITAAAVKNELEHINSLKTVYDETPAQKKLHFQCFGNFEAFADGVPVRFKYDKTKEMLAYIVSRRGALCSNEEIVINLWEDDNSHDSYLRGIRKDMIDTFKQYGLENVIFLQRGKIGIDISAISCDYYDFLQGDVGAINSYKGEFMSQFSWAEGINGELFLKDF